MDTFITNKAKMNMKIILFYPKNITLHWNMHFDITNMIILQLILKIEFYIYMYASMYISPI